MQDEKNGEVVTLLPPDYHNRWRISLDALEQARALIMGPREALSCDVDTPWVLEPRTELLYITVHMKTIAEHSVSYGLGTFEWGRYFAKSPAFVDLQALGQKSEFRDDVSDALRSMFLYIRLQLEVGEITELHIKAHTSRKQKKKKIPSLLSIAEVEALRKEVCGEPLPAGNVRMWAICDGRVYIHLGTLPAAEFGRKPDEMCKHPQLPVVLAERMARKRPGRRFKLVRFCAQFTKKGPLLDLFEAREVEIPPRSTS